MQPPQELAQAIHSAAEEFRLPTSVLLAWSWHATAWEVDSYRYDPNLDRLDVSGKPATWAGHPEWLVEGPTCEEFFLFHEEREAECLPEANYEFVAQTRLAAGYGPFLLRYPVALRRGFTDEPDALRTTEAVRWAAKVLKDGAEDGSAVGRRGDDALAFGLMCVGGRVPSRTQVFAVEAAHRTLFGKGYFEG